MVVLLFFLFFLMLVEIGRVKGLKKIFVVGMLKAIVVL